MTPGTPYTASLPLRENNRQRCTFIEGDGLVIHLRNKLSPGAAMMMSTMPEMSITPAAAGCCSSAMTTNSVNIHYHGTNVPPTCHQDEVIRTAADGGESFDYDVDFPVDEPPGLY